MTVKARAFQLASRPRGAPTADNFALVDHPLPELVAGSVLVENVYLSVDPYMRELMDAGWELNAPLEGRVIGRVVQSADPNVAVEEWVFTASRGERTPWWPHLMCGCCRRFQAWT